MDGERMVQHSRKTQDPLVVVMSDMLMREKLLTTPVLGYDYYSNGTRSSLQEILEKTIQLTEEDME